MRRLLSLLVLTALLLTGAACKSKATTVETGGAADSSSDDGASNAENGDGDADDATTEDFSARGSGDFCKLAKDAQDLEDEDTESPDTPAEYRAERDKFLPLIQDMKESAPSEIKKDVEIALAYLEKFYEVLEKYDYDFAKIPQGELDFEATEASSNRVSAYTETVCKLDTDGDGDTDGVTDSSGSSGTGTGGSGTTAP